MTDQLVRPATVRHVGEQFDDVMARIGELDPLLRAEADAGEAAGRLTPRVADALHDSGVYTMSMPRELGGLELTPRQVIAAVEPCRGRTPPPAGW